MCRCSHMYGYLCMYVCVCIYVCVYVSAYICVYMSAYIYMCIYMLFQKGPEFNLPLALLALTSMLLGYLGVWEKGDWV